MRHAFKMQLHPGQSAEYQRRHDAIWPELSALLRAAGISNYSIFLDAESHALLGVLDIADPAALDQLPAEAVMQRWWAYMADIMETHPDNRPLSVPLQEVFHLP